MWEQIRRWFGMGTPRPLGPLETAFLAQQKLIESTVARQQELLAQQQATLDRIVAARYDRPMERVVHPVRTETLPDWAMNDQGDVLPVKDEIGAGIAAIHVESDADFLKAAN